MESGSRLWGVAGFRNSGLGCGVPSSKACITTLVDYKGSVTEYCTAPGRV